MKNTAITAALLLCVALPSASTAQTNPPAPAPAATKAEAAPKLGAPHWRSSKLIGVNIYNEQNEKLGDINEIILDASGKVLGYVVGVGGFLGMGEHDILVEPNKIKFVNEPVRSTSTTTTTTTTTATKTEPGMTTRPVSNTTGRAANEQWYPDHGVLSATKEQLKALPQFKYSAYN